MRPIQTHPEVRSGFNDLKTHSNLDFPPDIDKPPFEVTETGYALQLIMKLDD